MPTKAKATDTITVTVSEDAIRQRAYFLWEADGRPDGRGDHYWYLATEEAQRAAAKPVKAAAPKAEKPAKAPPKTKAAASEAPKAPRKSARSVAAEAK
jgi:hypothetical protein